MTASDSTYLAVTDWLGRATTAPLPSFTTADPGSGYPLNAFIVDRKSPADVIGALWRRELSSVADNVIAIINCIFDCDGYSLWVPHRVFAFLAD